MRLGAGLRVRPGLGRSQRAQPKQASNERAQADLARMKPLVDKAEISQLQYDAYVAAARVAESELQAAQQKLASARKDAAIRQAALDAAAIACRPGQGAAADLRRQPQAGGHPHGRCRHRRGRRAAARANLEAAELSSATPPSLRPSMA